MEIETTTYTPIKLDDDPSSMLNEIDAMRMAYVRNSVTPAGGFKDDVDPKVALKAMDDTSKSLSRRIKQDAENHADVNMEQCRARALAIAEALVNNSSQNTEVFHKLDLPEIPVGDVVISPAELATGVVKLDLNDYRVR